MPLWKWRARRATKPIRDEHTAATQRVESGSEEWLRWWRANGQRELTCILMTAWDPVGASHAPEAWDEYENYVPAVAYRLRDAPDEEAAIEQVGEYLNHVERDFMGGLTDERRRSNGYLAGAWSPGTNGPSTTAEGRPTPGCRKGQPRRLPQVGDLSSG